MNHSTLISALFFLLIIIVGTGCPPREEGICLEQSQQIAQLKTAFDQAIVQCDTATAAVQIRAIAQVCQRYDTDPLQRQMQAVKCPLPEDKKSKPAPASQSRKKSPKTAQEEGWPEGPEIEAQ